MNWMIRDHREGTFEAWAAQVIGGATALSDCRYIHVVDVDHWFDEKWLGFSGKMLGALAVWKGTLTVPPFDPSRIVAEQRYEKTDHGVVVAAESLAVHRAQPSANNLQRRFADILPDTSAFWLSVDADATGRGALMGYVRNGDALAAWYVGTKYEGGAWHAVTLAGIARVELGHFQEAGA